MIALALDCRKNLVQNDSMKIGYARVFSEKQNLDLQIKAQTGPGCDQILTDKAQSGTKVAETRSSFSEAMDQLQQGDLLIIWKLDRVGRSIADLIQERTKTGLRAAKKRGKRLGRPPALTPAQVKQAKAAISAKREAVSGMAEILDVNRSTIQRAIGASR